MTEQEIAIQQLEIEQERLQIEKTKAKQDGRFWSRNFATVITTAVTLAAVLVTSGQVWVAKISKDKELAVTAAQKDKELLLIGAQKDKELALLVAQQEREWNLNTAKFVTEHANVIFGKDKEQRERISFVMIATFPPSITNALFQRLEALPNSPEGQQVWRNARERIIPKIDEPQQTSSGVNYGSLDIQVIDSVTKEPIKGAVTIKLSNLDNNLFNQEFRSSTGHLHLDKIAASPVGRYSVVALADEYEYARVFANVAAGKLTAISLSARSKKQSE